MRCGLRSFEAGKVEVEGIGFLESAVKRSECSGVHGGVMSLAGGLEIGMGQGVVSEFVAGRKVVVEAVVGLRGRARCKVKCVPGGVRRGVDRVVDGVGEGA